MLWLEWRTPNMLIFCPTLSRLYHFAQQLRVPCQLQEAADFPLASRRVAWDVIQYSPSTTHKGLSPQNGQLRSQRRCNCNKNRQRTEKVLYVWYLCIAITASRHLKDLLMINKIKTASEKSELFDNVEVRLQSILKKLRVFQPFSKIGKREK